MDTFQWSSKMLITMGVRMKIWIKLLVYILLRLFLLRPRTTCKRNVRLKVKSHKLAR